MRTVGRCLCPVEHLPPMTVESWKRRPWLPLLPEMTEDRHCGECKTDRPFRLVQAEGANVIYICQVCAADYVKAKQDLTPYQQAEIISSQRNTDAGNQNTAIKKRRAAH